MLTNDEYRRRTVAQASADRTWQSDRRWAGSVDDFKRAARAILVHVRPVGAPFGYVDATGLLLAAVGDESCAASWRWQQRASS